MKILITALIITIIGITKIAAQIVANVEIKEPIEGICNDQKVYAIFPSFKDQEEAKCEINNAEILKKLNEIQFIKDHPKFKSDGMIGLKINCVGILVQCKMDNKTKNKELDKQIEEVFNSLGLWNPGKINGKEVDTSLLYSFKVKKGKITWN